MTYTSFRVPIESHTNPRGTLPQNSRFAPLSDSMSDNPSSAIAAIIFSVLGLAILSMIYEGWLFGGVSFQQTTVGGPVWYITQRLVDLVYPST